MTNLVNSEVKNLGLVELSDDQLMDINGGAEKKDIWGKVVDFGTSVVNTGKEVVQTIKDVPKDIGNALKSIPAVSVECKGTFGIVSQKTTSPSGATSETKSITAPVCNIVVKPAK